jgi:hypothetical protein
MDTPVSSKSDRIRTLNDAARRTFAGCTILITPVVPDLGDAEKPAAMWGSFLWTIPVGATRNPFQSL